MHDLAITSRVERTVTITWGVKYFALPSIGNCHKNMIPHIALEYWEGFTKINHNSPRRISFLHSPHSSCSCIATNPLIFRVTSFNTVGKIHWVI